MAKIYNFHIYQTKAEPVDSSNRSEFEKFNIRIINGKNGDFIDEVFKNNDVVAIANEVDPPGGRGGGGVCELAEYLESFFRIATTVVLTATTTGFFGEMGKDLYKKLLSVLFNKEMPTKLIVERKYGQNLEIIIPPKTDISNLKNVENYLNKIGNKCGKVIYDPKSKNFIYLEECDYLGDEPLG